jgi:hypothetical protein
MPQVPVLQSLRPIEADAFGTVKGASNVASAGLRTLTRGSTTAVPKEPELSLQPLEASR